jgi:hypothetical protein
MNHAQLNKRTIDDGSFGFAQTGICLGGITAT